MGDHGHQRVVLLGREGHHLGAEGGDHGLQPGVGGGIGGPGRGEHPGGPDEQLAVGAVDAHLLGAGHGVAPHEAGVVDRGHQRALHPGHVGEHGVGVARRLGEDARR